MLTGKYVKLERIIEGVDRDFGFTHQVDWVDLLEWVGECLDLIGAHKQYVQKVTDGNEELGHPCPVDITKYRGTLPCDIVSINQVRDWKTKTPMRYAGDTFFKDLPITEADLPAQSFTSFGRITFSSNLIERQQRLKDSCDTEYSYTLNDNHIFCNFETGCVELSYTAFPVDEKGYPLIPDNIKYIQAVKAYIGERIGFKLFLQNKLDGQRYGKLEQERMWYIGAATTAGHIPNYDEAESWKNQILRLVPNINFHTEGFRYMGDPSKQNNWNSI